MNFHIIGDEDTVLGYRFAGVGASVVGGREEAVQAFTEVLEQGQCKILLMTEIAATMIEPELVEHRLKSAPPFVVEIGDLAGTDVKMKSMEQLIYEAVGIRILREDTDE